MKNKDFITKLYLSVIFLLLCAIVISCGPAAQQRRSEQKLSKLIKENPQLVTSDTIKKDSIIQPATIRERTELDLDSTESYIAINELTAKFVGSGPTADGLNEGMKDIVNHAGDIDTNVNSGKTKLHIKKSGNKLTVDAMTTPDPIKVPIETVINTVKPVPIATWYERLFVRIGKTTGLVGSMLVLLLLFYILYRIVKKSLT